MKLINLLSLKTPTPTREYRIKKKNYRKEPGSSIPDPPRGGKKKRVCVDSPRRCEQGDNYVEESTGENHG